MSSFLSKKWVRRLLVFVSLIFIFGLSISLFSWNQRVVVKYDFFEDLNAPSLAVPESERAWPHLREALLELDFQDQGSLPELLDALDEGIDQDWVIEWFARHELELGGIRDALARERLGFIHVFGVPQDDDRLILLTGFEQDEALSLPSPAVGPDDFKNHLSLEYKNRLTALPRILSRILLDHAKRAARSGDFKSTVADIIASLDLARLVGQDRMLMSQLVGYAVRSLTYATLLEVMSDPAMRPEHAALDELARQLENPRHVPGEIDLFGERGIIRDLIQRLYSDDGDGDGDLLLSEFIPFSGVAGTQLPRVFVTEAFRPFLSPVVSSLADSRAEVEDAAEQAFQAAESLQSQQSWELDWTAHDAIFSRIHLNSSMFHFFPLPLVLPSFEAMILRSHDIRFQFEFARLLVALHRYEVREGRWPQQLQALVPDFISEIPRDPYDGEALRYRLVDEGPMLWSVGPDRIDQSGVSSNEKVLPGLRLERDDVLSPPAGEDLVLWPLTGMSPD